MNMQAKIGSFSRDDERAQTPGHGPVLLAGALKADDGVYPVGLLLTRKADGKLEPLQKIAGEVLAAGDGATKDFSGTLATGLPVEPGTITISDGVETFVDDGSGRLVGDAGGSGTINYKTGGYAVSFNANVVNEVDVVGNYATKIAGVLDELVDTAERGAGLYIRHGTCRADVLKIGAVAKDLPTASDLMLLQENGIYPV